MIESIVVLMMENRSFDNVLGWIYAPDNVSPNGDAFNGLTKDLFNPPFPGSTERVFVASTTDHKNPIEDPGEVFQHVNVQLFQSDPPPTPLPSQLCLGFLYDYSNVLAKGSVHLDPTVIMAAFDPSIVSCTRAIAQQFAVCDQWFSSVPSQTWPNRAFVHAATSNGNINNWPYDPAQWDVPTIFNVMSQRSGSTWRVYYDNVLVPLTWLQMRQLHPFGYWKNFHGVDDLWEDARSGNLPQYAFIEPSFFSNPAGGPANDAHPPHNAFIADQFIGKVYNAIVSGPQFQAGEVLLVITFDEHGGCYDHVAPFTNATRTPQTNPQFDFSRFGVRVPTIVVSPYVTRGSVFNVPPGASDGGPSTYTPYDHTSILKTVESTFGYQPLSPRDAAAPDLTALLTAALRTDYEPVAMPAPTAALQAEAASDMAASTLATQPLNDLQISIVAGLAHVAAAPVTKTAAAVPRMVAPDAAAAASSPRTVGDAIAWIRERAEELGWR